MEKCPININNGFNNILFKLNLLNKNSLTLNQDRKKLFYYICIPIRILIALIFLFLFLYFKNNYKIQKNLSLIAIFFTFFTFAHLVSKEFSNNDCVQWWSNKFEIFLSFIAFITSLYCYFNNKDYCMLSLFIIMFVSIISGITQSLIIKPFN